MFIINLIIKTGDEIEVTNEVSDDKKDAYKKLLDTEEFILKSYGLRYTTKTVKGGLEFIYDNNVIIIIILNEVEDTNLMYKIS